MRYSTSTCHLVLALDGIGAALLFPSLLLYSLAIFSPFFFLFLCENAFLCLERVSYLSDSILTLHEALVFTAALVLIPPTWHNSFTSPASGGYVVVVTTDYLEYYAKRYAKSNVVIFALCVGEVCNLTIGQFLLGSGKEIMLQKILY